MSSFVFVFGTLKEGFPNFATNRGLRQPGVFATKERYPLYLVGERHSPWLIDTPGRGEHVLGQVFEVNAETLAQMDLLERVNQPDGYERLRIDVVSRSEKTATPMAVFAYLKPAARLDGAVLMAGPLAEYTLGHAALYRHWQR